MGEVSIAQKHIMKIKTMKKAMKTKKTGGNYVISGTF